MSQLRDRLRSATHEEHLRLHDAPLFKAITDGSVPITAYAAWVRSMTVIVGGLEQELERSTDERVRSLWEPLPQRLPLLRTDTRALDAVESQPSDAPLHLLELVQTLRTWGRNGDLALVGALYVMQGSALGGQVLTGPLSERFGESVVSYVSGAGAETEADWESFCEQLDRTDFGTEEARVVVGAQTVFAALRRIMTRLHPCENDGHAVSQAINFDAGTHDVTTDPRELVAAVDAGVMTWSVYPYYEARYGGRGRRFTRSDSAWLVTLAYAEPDVGRRQIKWLVGLLAARGMPSLLFEEHLFHLRDALVDAVPERAEIYGRLAELGEELRHGRLEAVPDFDSLAASFPHTDPIANVGPILVAAVADERQGYENAVDSVSDWLTASDHFGADWIASVAATIESARAS